jgi:NADH:ubiquinone reductase (H+-translocating)
MENPLHIVIVGAGFGGLWAARAFSRAEVRVTLIDRNNYHGFWPLLYQVAAAELDAEQIAYPVRRILRRHRNVTFYLRDVHDGGLRCPQLAGGRTGQLTYDYLILALGSTSSYFNIPGAAEHTFP